MATDQNIKSKTLASTIYCFNEYCEQCKVSLGEKSKDIAIWKEKLTLELELHDNLPEVYLELGPTSMMELFC